jgi:16S rRNA (guanine527-N7)-methyltransferase
MFHVEPINLIEVALKEGKLTLPIGALEYFTKYRKMLLDWNQKINLISRGDELRIVTRHFLQSLGLLTIVPFPQECSVVDLGSGGGFPGIPMKIVRPDLHMFLIESKRKKALFLCRVIETLGLENVQVLLIRAEKLKDRIQPVDFVVSRSVADLVSVFNWSRQILKPKGRLIIIKGSNVDHELDRLKKIIPDMESDQCQVIRYNPFPRVFQLSKSYAVVLRMK